jgi:hypothetical protein
VQRGQANSQIKAASAFFDRNELGIKDEALEVLMPA